MSNSMTAWYLARGAGISAFATLSVATAMGAATARHTRNLDRRVVLQYVHRAAALAGVLLLALHVSMLVIDSYANVGLVGVFVPFASGYRPAAVALGVLSMYLLVTVAVTGLLRARFARSARATRLWRGIHLSAYVAWAASAWHFLVSGTDSGQWWARAVLYAGIGVVGLGLLTRLTDRGRVTSRPAAPARRTASLPPPVSLGAHR
jgi:predicted ferric reductase